MTLKSFPQNNKHEFFLSSKFRYSKFSEIYNLTGGVGLSKNFSFFEDKVAINSGLLLEAGNNNRFLIGIDNQLFLKKYPSLNGYFLPYFSLFIPYQNNSQRDYENFHLANARFGFKIQFITDSFFDFKIGVLDTINESVYFEVVYIHPIFITRKPTQKQQLKCPKF